MAFIVTVSHLKAIAQDGKAPLASVLVGPINTHAPANGIDTKELMAHFLCHMEHETGHFKSMVEGLNYSVAGLLNTFGRHRISKEDAQRLGRKDNERVVPLERQKQIANIIYGGAWGKKNLGNTQPNDGWDYRGSGPYQLTGRANFRKFGDIVGVDLVGNPDLARNPDHGVEIAAKYFAARMKKFALKNDIVGETAALNGGALGLTERKAALARALKAFGAKKTTLGLMSETVDEEVAADDAEESTPSEITTVPDEIDDTDEVITDEGTVERVQNRLRELGYTEVGTPNGKIGQYTKTAVRAYRADRGLADGDFIDQELVDALDTDDTPREQPVSRQEVTAEEIRDKVPEVKANFLTRVWMQITGIGALVWSAIQGIMDNIGDASDHIRPLKSMLVGLPSWVWPLAIAVAAYSIYRIAARGEKVGSEAFKTGARR